MNIYFTMLHMKIIMHNFIYQFKWCWTWKKVFKNK